MRYRHLSHPAPAYLSLGQFSRAPTATLRAVAWSCFGSAQPVCYRALGATQALGASARSSRASFKIHGRSHQTVPAPRSSLRRCAHAFADGTALPREGDCFGASAGQSPRHRLRLRLRLRLRRAAPSTPSLKKYVPNTTAETRNALSAGPAACSDLGLTRSRMTLRQVRFGLLSPTGSQPDQRLATLNRAKIFLYPDEPCS